MKEDSLISLLSSLIPSVKLPKLFDDDEKERNKKHH